MKKFPVHMAISILQALNCQCLTIFVHDIYCFSLYFKAKTQWNKGMSEFYSGNSDNCVLLNANLLETKREKKFGPRYQQTNTMVLKRGPSF